MVRYKDQDWHKLWTTAKKADKLPQSLFRKGLGKALDQQRALYKKLMATTDPKTFTRLARQHGEAAVKLRTTIVAYQKTLRDRGGAQDAVNTLTKIHSAVYNDMMDDRLDRQRELGLHK